MIELSGRIRSPGTPARALLAILATSLLCPRAANADERAESIVEKAHWLEQRGQTEQAQELLRRAATEWPEDELIVLARAEAYRAAKNPFWALKVLGEWIDRKPPACSARAMAARIHLDEANLEQAAQLLDTPGCDQQNALRLRFLLLRIEMAALRGEPRQARALTLLGQQTAQRFEEDDRRLARLAKRYDPEHEPSFTSKLDIGAGWTGHGMGSVPLDLPSFARRSGSWLVGLDLNARWIPAEFTGWRPVAETELHLAQYLEAPASGLSSRQPIIRLGAELGREPRRLALVYAGDWMQLEGGDSYATAGTATASGHRFEARLDIGHSLYAHAAIGRRLFWQRGRNRTESEQGLSKTIALSDSLNLLVGATWRLYSAEQRAYDQFGISAHAALLVAMPRGFELRESIALSEDLFPRSAGYFGEPASERRQDTLLRLGIGVTAPDVAGVKLGVSYGYVNRDSNAAPYGFTDHRGSLSLSWQTDSDQLRVSRIAKTGRVPMPYPDDSSGADAKQPVQVIEVIQRDESQRRNTSCMK